MRLFSTLALAALALPAYAGQTDLSFPPGSGGAHDFNHAPIGQTFVAVASQVRGGLYLADQTAAYYAGSYPYAVRAVLDVELKLFAGATASGTPLYSETRTLAAPYSGFVEVDYNAAGITLTPGQTYTLLVTDLRPGDGTPTGWQIPSVIDTSQPGQPTTDANGTIVGYLPYGAYAKGQPVLQGQVVLNDAGIGDNAFRVLNAAPCSGVDQTITAIGRSFFSVNGGNTVADHVWYAPQSGTTYLDGASGIATGQVVSWEGSLAADGCHAAFMTIRPGTSVPPPPPPPVPPLVLGTTTLPGAQVGVAYGVTLQASGGTPPYTWASGALPSGLKLSADHIKGTPTAAGTKAVTLTVVDALGKSASLSTNLVVQAAAPCSAPVGSKASSDKGRISKLGVTSLVLGSKTIALNACTTIRWNRSDRVLHLDDRIDVTGYSVGSVTTASVIDVR